MAMSNIMASSIAAIANVYLCQPLDVLKTRIQENPMRCGFF